MTKNEILDKLILLKPALKKDGITLLGIFGSYARGDYTQESDIDILYKLDDAREFTQRNGGFGAFTKLIEIKESISGILKKPIDFVDKDALNEIGREFILKELKYV